MSNQASSFYDLSPHDVLNGIESVGYPVTGRYLQLNSYENRVFDVELELDVESEEDPDSNKHKHLVAKFYRPQRWSKSAISEEHIFVEQLAADGLDVAETLQTSDGSYVNEYNGLYFSLFEKTYGRMPQEFSSDNLQRVGRALARLHMTGQKQPAKHRPHMTSETYGYNNLEILKQWIAPEVSQRYLDCAEDILAYLDDFLQPDSFLRIHGDCHRGNILQTDVPGEPSRFFFVDFDDFCMGPEVQDFWMLLSSQEQTASELESLLTGYEELRTFPKEQIQLLTPLRGLRIIHYAAWIARRWQDPSFPQIFPQFESYTYWAEETEALEQIAWSL